MPELGIITPIYGSDEYTDSFIKQLSSVKGNFEVIIIDNKGTYEDKSRKPDKRIKILRPGKNLGFSGGNNYGVRYSTSDTYLFVNNDVVFHDPNFLDSIKATKTESNVIGQQLVDYNSLTAIDGVTTPYINGWCVVLSKDQYDEIEGWDEDFGIGYFEDVYLSAKLSKLGYELKEVDLGIEHLGGKSFQHNPDRDLITQTAQKVFVSKMRELCGNKRIVFLYNGEFDFNDEDYEGKGVGGAESALILMTRELVKHGWDVSVYNNTSVEAVFKGVKWLNISSFNRDDPCDIFVLYRDPFPDLVNIRAKTKLFFSCDQITGGDWNLDILPHVDKMICISPFHKEYVLKHYNIKEDKIIVMDLGVKDSDYVEPLEKKPNKLIYCSVPNRGLKHLAKAFPLIKEQIPDVELYITSDYRLWGAPAENEKFWEIFSSIKGVHFLGMVPREELVYHQKTAEIMAYPCTYDENFCISAMECIASKTVPITFDFGAMSTTVSDSGVVLRGNPEYEPSAIKNFVTAVVELLKDKHSMQETANRGYYRAKENYYWSVLGKYYSRSFNELLNLHGRKLNMHKCDVCEKSFKTSFEMFKHRNSHKPKETTSPYDADKRIKVKIRTSKRVQLSIGKEKWDGAELLVSRGQSIDVVRILKEAYGKDIIEEMSVGN